MLIPISFLKTEGFDPDAKAFFDSNSLNDYPQYAKIAWNKRVIAMKVNGVWNGSIGGPVFLPTLSIFEPLKNAKNITVSYTGLSVSPGENTAPYVTNNIITTTEGVNFYEGQTVGTGYLDSGVIPISSLTLNSTAIAIGSPRDESPNVGSSFGTYNGASSSIIFQKRSLLSACTADMYGTTVGTGRASQASGADGAKGCYFLNRASSVDFKLYKNGVQIASTTATQGTLPTTPLYLNKYNGAICRNQPISYFWIYGSGMTAAQAIQESADWNTFASEIERFNTYNKNVVIDGNSHTVYYKSAFVRALSYYNGGIGFIAQYHQTGISGQATAGCLANAPTNIDPLYNSTIAKNIYVCWEVTNDISSGLSLSGIQNNYQQLCAGRRAVGFKVLAMPAMCRDFSGDMTKILMTNDFNIWLASNWMDFADDVIDPNDPLLGNNYFIKRLDYSSDTAYKTAVLALTDNPTYFSDGSTHLTLLGYHQWGTLVANKIRNL